MSFNGHHRRPVTAAIWERKMETSHTNQDAALEITTRLVEALIASKQLPHQSVVRADALPQAIGEAFGSLLQAVDARLAARQKGTP
jgi:hypothetical protein